MVDVHDDDGRLQRMHEAIADATDHLNTALMEYIDCQRAKRPVPIPQHELNLVVSSWVSALAGMKRQAEFKLRQAGGQFEQPPDVETKQLELWYANPYTGKEQQHGESY